MRVRYAWYRDGLLGGQIAVRVDDEGVRRRAGYPGGFKLEKAGGHSPGNDAREARVCLKRVVEPGDDAGTEERPADILDVPEEHQGYGREVDRGGCRSADDDRRFHRRKERRRGAQLEGRVPEGEIHDPGGARGALSDELNPVRRVRRLEGGHLCPWDRGGSVQDRHGEVACGSPMRVHAQVDPLRHASVKPHRSSAFGAVVGGLVRRDRIAGRRRSREDVDAPAVRRRRRGWGDPVGVHEGHRRPGNRGCGPPARGDEAGDLGRGSRSQRKEYRDPEKDHEEDRERLDSAAGSDRHSRFSSVHPVNPTHRRTGCGSRRMRRIE